MTDLPHPIAEAFAATNAADMPRFLSAFAPDGVVDDGGRRFAGHEAIERWSRAESIGLDQTIAQTGVRAVGDQTIISATIGGRGYTGPATFHITLSADRKTIATMRITG